MHSHQTRQDQHDATASSGSFWGSRTFWVFLGFLAIALTMLLSEHRAHFLGALPLLFLLACPLLHIFGHGGHTGHVSQSNERKSAPPEIGGDKS